MNIALAIIGILFIYVLGIFGIKYLRGRFQFFRTNDPLDFAFGDLIGVWPITFCFFIPVVIIIYIIQQVIYLAEYIEDSVREQQYKKLEEQRQLRNAERELQAQEFFEDMKQ